MTGNIQDGQERFMVIIRNRYFGAESPIRYQYAGFLPLAAKQRLVNVSDIAYFDEGHKQRQLNLVRFSNILEPHRAKNAKP
jgi:hypothetical protein